MIYYPPTNNLSDHPWLNPRDLFSLINIERRLGPELIGLIRNGILSWSMIRLRWRRELRISMSSLITSLIGCPMMSIVSIRLGSVLKRSIELRGFDNLIILCHDLYIYWVLQYKRNRYIILMIKRFSLNLSDNKIVIKITNKPTKYNR